MSQILPSRIIGLLAAATLALVGCGGSGDSRDNADKQVQKSDAASTGTPTPTPSPSPTIDKAAERKLAEESTLKLEDFPSGWTEADSDDDSNTSGCDAVETAKTQTTARATAPSFSHGDSTQVQNSIYVFADEQTAAGQFEQLTLKETRSCYAKAVAKALATAGGLKVGKVESSRLSMDPLGDDRDAGCITVPVTSQGVDVDVVVDMVFVRADRGMTITLFIDVFTPFDSDLRDQLTVTSVRRLSDNLNA